MMKTLIAKILILAGILLISYSIYISWKRMNPKRLSFQNYQKSVKKNKKTILPKSLIIKSLNIDLPVESVEIQNNVWPISEIGVSYLFSSGNPGENGNAIFFGHNFENILGNLQKAKINQVIEIKMQNKKTFKYKIFAIATVKPSQIEILKQSKEKILTLYTCSGFFDEKRLVITAKQIE